MVALRSAMIAGPAMTEPGKSLSRAYTGVSWRLPPVVMPTRAIGKALDIVAGLATINPGGASERPTASTETASAMSARSRMRKLKRLRYWLSNSSRIAAVSPSGTASDVSVPSYLRCTRFSSRSSAEPCAVSSRTHASPRRTHFSSMSVIAVSSRRRSTASSRSDRTCASPMPYAERTPASGWM